MFWKMGILIGISNQWWLAMWCGRTLQYTCIVSFARFSTKVPCGITVNWPTCTSNTIGKQQTWLIFKVTSIALFPTQLTWPKIESKISIKKSKGSMQVRCMDGFRRNFSSCSESAEICHADSFHVKKISLCFSIRQKNVEKPDENPPPSLCLQTM